MDLDKLKQQLDEKSGLGRFVPIPPPMRKIRNHSELETLRQGGVGFIINIRPEGAKIHRVNCEATEVMSTSQYPKVFSQTVDDAVHWVMTGNAWENCGLCGGAEGAPAPK